MSAINGMFPPFKWFFWHQHASTCINAGLSTLKKVFGVVLRSLGIAKANWHWAVSNIFKRLHSMKSYEILIGMERFLPWNNPQMVLTSIAKYAAINRVNLSPLALEFNVVDLPGAKNHHSNVWKHDNSKVVGLNTWVTWDIFPQMAKRVKLIWYLKNVCNHPVSKDYK